MSPRSGGTIWIKNPFFRPAERHCQARMGPSPITSKAKLAGSAGSPGHPPSGDVDEDPAAAGDQRLLRLMAGTPVCGGSSGRRDPVDLPDPPRWASHLPSVLHRWGSALEELARNPWPAPVALKNCSGIRPECLRALRIALGFGRAGAADGPIFFDSCSHRSGRAGLGEPLDRLPLLSSLLF